MAWALLADVASLYGVSEAVFREKYLQARCRLVGGVREVMLSSLPADVQARCLGLAVTADAPAPDPAPAPPDPEDVPAPPPPLPPPDMAEIPPLYVEIAKAYSEAPDHAKVKINKYDSIIKACAGLQGKKALDAFVAKWNEEHPAQKTSYPSIIRIRRELAEVGGEALRGKHGKARGRTRVPDGPYQYFKSLWLSDRRLTNADCWQKACGWALEHGHNKDSFPTVGAFMRRLKNDVPEGARYRARYGNDIYNRKYGSTVRRDYGGVMSGECWVADHTRLDIMVTDPVSGKASRPELTVWRDFKSGMWLSYDLHLEASSSTHIFRAFRAAAKKWGVPRYFYIDNGKDFTSKDLTGGKPHRLTVSIEPERLSMAAKLGIEVLHAKPYHGQSKPIERDFRVLEEKFCKNFSGYTGNTTVAKPESLKKALATMNLTAFGEFGALLDDFVWNIMNRRVISSGYRAGKSPLEIMAEEHPKAAAEGVIRRVTDDQLALLCYRTSRPMTISRNWIRDGECGVEYYADWVLGFTGRKVYLRRDYDDVSKALVYDYATNEFLGEVAAVESVPALAKTDYERGILVKRMAENKLTEKVVRLMHNTDMDITAAEAQAALKRFVRSREKEAAAEDAAASLMNAPVMLTGEAEVIAKKVKMAEMDSPDLSAWGGVEDAECPSDEEIYGFDYHRENDIRNVNVG